MNNYLSITAICISVIGLLIEHFVMIAGMQERIKGLEVKIEPFWNYIDQQLPKLFHSPELQHKEKDVLLEKMVDRQLTKEDAERLKEILKCEVLEDPTKTHKVEFLLPTILILARLDQIILQPNKKVT
jgi:hypothetical protein